MRDCKSEDPEVVVPFRVRVGAGEVRVTKCQIKRSDGVRGEKGKPMLFDGSDKEKHYGKWIGHMWMSAGRPRREDHRIVTLMHASHHERRVAACCA